LVKTDKPTHSTERTTSYIPRDTPQYVSIRQDIGLSGSQDERSGMFAFGQMIMARPRAITKMRKAASNVLLALMDSFGLAVGAAGCRWPQKWQGSSS